MPPPAVLVISQPHALTADGWSTAGHPLSMSTVNQTLRIGPAWNPEDPDFWARHGRALALRNLVFIIPAMALSFAVWMLWSVLVVHLPAAGFRYSTNQLFWLSALPALCGATLRIFYGLALPWVGGRRWTSLSTASLLLPAGGIAWAVQDPSTPYETMVLLSLLCGLGGANFASGVAHISACFPAHEQGAALGVGAGFAHLGVSLAQWLVPAIIALNLFDLPQPAGQALWLANAGLVWLPLIVLASLAAWLGMNDVQRGDLSLNNQAQVFTRRHSWLMGWLYLGSFGSFIGFAAAFPLVAEPSVPGPGDGASIGVAGPAAGRAGASAGGWAGRPPGRRAVSLIGLCRHSCSAWSACFASLDAGDGPGCSWPASCCCSVPPGWPMAAPSA
jgi:NNP family nitrate/nitrite transporter-like MFS transporter